MGTSRRYRAEAQTHLRYFLSCRRHTHARHPPPIRPLANEQPCSSPLTSASCGGNWHQAVFSVDADDTLAGGQEGDTGGEDGP